MSKWLVACAAALAALFALWVYRDLRRPYRAYSGNLILTVEPGARAPEVAEVLVSRGVLAHRLPFLALYSAGRLRHRTLKAGEYLFDPPATPVEVYEKLEQGKIYFHLVVIPEGSDRFDMAHILQQQLHIAPEEFLSVTQQTAAIRDLDPEAATLEGYLFPDSYRFPHEASAAVVVETMLARFRQILASRFPGLAPGSSELHDAITLASLVEKETPEPGERPVIAGVFERRLAKGMLLECDPTVVYAVRLDQGGATPSGPLTESELNSASPYNTYRQPGLPPGPICSPGEASIHAALDPAGGETLYFVSNNRGGHVFASTLAEHQRNVARYRREVTALRHTNSAEDSMAQPSKNSLGGEHDNERIRASKGSVKSARSKKQKRAHSRVPPGPASGTSRTKRDAVHSG